MTTKTKEFVPILKRVSCGPVLALAIATIGAGQMQAQLSYLPRNSGRSTMTEQTKFYCNAKALNPTQRARHEELTDKLVARRKDIKETEKGYEFRFSPSTVSLAELAEWVANESKCCPFFDFHIDLEGEGGLLCLRLTGEEGVKAFVKAEFRVPSK
jgi:hypothetical protein